MCKEPIFSVPFFFLFSCFLAFYFFIIRIYIGKEGEMSNVKTNAKILLSLLIIVLVMISFGTISTHAASLPSKGHVYTGTATAEKVHADYSNTGKSTCVFRNHGDNAFATHVRTYKAKCKSPGVWDPKKGEKYNYRATVTSVNTTSGLVQGTITYTPAGHLKGYRQIMGTLEKWKFKIPQNVKITMKKVSANTAMTKGNDYYSLKGTTFGVYAKKSGTTLSSKKGELVVKDNSGNTNTLSLPKGTYYAKELKAGKGYQKKDEKGKTGHIYTIKATKSKSTPYTFTAKDCPGNDPVAIQINKIDKSGIVHTEPGVLAGAKFELSFYGDSNKNKVIRSWIFETKDDGRIEIRGKLAKEYFVSGDDFYRDENGNVAFPYGKYVVREIEAPKGFALDPDDHPVTLSPNATATGAVHSAAKIDIPEKAARANIKFSKVLEKQKEKTLCQTCKEDISEQSKEERIEKHGKNYYCSQCGVEETASHNKEDVEKHIKEKHPKTENVQVSYEKETGVKVSWDKVDSAASYEVFYSVDDEKYMKIGETDKTEFVDDECNKDEGVISYYKIRAISDNLTGEYSDSGKINVFDELKEGGTENKDQTGETTEGKDETGKEETNAQTDNAEVKDEVTSEEKKDSENEENKKDEKPEAPKVHDTSKAETLASISIKEEPSVRIYKTVYPDKFERNRLSNVKFKITKKDTGESHEIKTDENGNYDSKNDANIWFGKEDEKKDGAGKFIAGKYTITELKSDENKNAKMIDPVDFVIEKDKTELDLGTFVNIENTLYTTATSEDTGDHIGYGNGPIKIKDKVEYKNAIVGKEYTVTGTLMDKKTGKEFLDKNGNNVTATETFVAKEADGFVELTFSFDGTKVAMNHKLVAFERMTQDDELFGVHESIDDKEQTVVFPEIHTTAIGDSTGTNLISGTGTQTVTDTVSYDNVLTGKEYTLKGWLVTKDGKKIDGSETEKKFAASEESGKVSMSLSFDASKYAGSDVVVFEELYYNGKLIADHKDSSADSQTVHVSKIGTKAINKDLKVNVLSKTGPQNIVDTVSYTNLIKGKTYTAKSWLMNPDTGDRIDGTEVTKEFSAEEANGTIDMELSFTQDENNPLSKVVVFEEVYLGDKVVGEHKDINDGSQTLNIVEIGTKAAAVDSTTDETSGVRTKTIVDTIHYDGLTPGSEYTAKGWLVDSEGNKIEGTDAEKKFTPEKAVGDVDVELKVNASQYTGDDVHVFEEVYLDGTLVGEHKDKDEPNQTIHISGVDTMAVGDKTHINLIGNKGQQVISDSVSYQNLDNTKTYTLKSWVVDKETGEMISGSESKKEFVPSQTETQEAPDLDESGDNSTEEVKPGDSGETKEDSMAKAQDNTDEENAENPDESGDNSGEDIENPDENQGNDGDKTENKKDENQDSSSEKPGEETEEKVQGERVSGIVETTISVDGAKAKGKTLVVFQEVYDENGHLIGEHKDVNSEDQFVLVPEIGTKASLSGKLSNLFTGSGKKTVKDTIKYKNLIRDQKYEVTSYLVYKNGKKVPGTTGTTSFMPKDSNGEVTVKIDVDTDKLKGDKELVAFEEIRLKGEFIADHKDVNDKEQTVTVKTPTPPITGDTKKMLPWIILAVVIAGGIGTVVYKKKTMKK